MKLAIGDSMLATDDDNTRFWINRPGIPGARDHYSLRSQFDGFRSRTMGQKEGGFEWYGDERLLAMLIGADVLEGFFPLFCNSEYDNWLGWVETRHGWRLVRFDLGMQRIQNVWEGLDDLVKGITEGRFGEGVTYDGEGRIVLADMPEPW